MAPIGHQRIAQRFSVPTTPIRWKVPKRRGLTVRSKPALAEAAIIEVSIMGAAVVAPLKWRAVVGTRVEVEWEDQSGLVIVRREVPYPNSTTLALYGVEYADNGSPLAKALFERLVLGPQEGEDAPAGSAAAEAEGRTPGADRASVWAAPIAWGPEAGAR